MKELIIMQGVSGSGKSFTAAALHYYYTQMNVECHVLSTDDYWYNMHGENTEKYEFEPKLLGKAHRWNQERVLIYLEEETDVVIVDNTNVKQKDAQPYIDMARDHDYNVRIVSVDTEPHTIKEANDDRPEDRKVPGHILQKQRRLLKKLHLD